MWDVFRLPLWKGEPATVAGKRVVNQYLLCGLAMSGLLALVLGTAASSSPANIVFPTISTAPLPHAFQPLMRMLPAALLGIMVVCVATAHWYMRVDKWIRSAQERCEKAGTSVP